MNRYGDRYPKSVIGRIFSVSWALCGIVLTSLLVSAVASPLLTVVAKEIFVQAEPGRVFGVIQDSPGESYFRDVLVKSGASSKY